MYRFVTPMPRRSASGSVTAVYAQSVAEQGAAFSPYLSPAPDLHAAAWATLRESQLTGRAPRARKEATAAAVAVSNSCPFCVDTYKALVQAAGPHPLADVVARGQTPPDPADAALVAWAAATRTPGAAKLRTLPFPPDQAAEYIGTVLVNHFINRMIDALRPGLQLTTNRLLAGPARRPAGQPPPRAALRPPRPGHSLPLLADVPAGPPAWAGDTPVGPAYAALRRAAAVGGNLLSDPGIVQSVLSWWDGTHPPLFGSWLAEALAAAPPRDRPGTRLALLAAVAPYRLTDADVAAWRGNDRTDADLVRLLAYGAITAVDRIEAGITGLRTRHAIYEPVEG